MKLIYASETGENGNFTQSTTIYIRAIIMVNNVVVLQNLKIRASTVAQWVKPLPKKLISSEVPV